ncbi:MAG: DUF554 domain-containing protein [Tannerellaceae bacterium]|jgi:uncharacterized membrane protein YqgA involved in biofilm formation|nr:DUF554 domain-containing protein [Tannerellaceae bacterium]
MTGTIVNTAAVVAGSLIGMTLGGGMKAAYREVYFRAVGLFTLLLGAKMALDMSSPLVIVISLVGGGFVGVKFQLDRRTAQLGDSVKKKLPRAGEHFTEGLTTAFLLFCAGSMTIVGAIEEGLGRTSDLLLTKSVMDFFSAIMLASGMGLGVLCSAGLVLVFQGGITLLVGLVGSGVPEVIISNVSAVGGIILMGLAVELLGIKKMEVVNLLPAIIIVSLLSWLEMLFF